MSDRTATQTMIAQHTLELEFGPRPSDIETEEQYLRWMIANIDRKARRDAQPYIDRLVQIENDQYRPFIALLLKDMQQCST